MFTIALCFMCLAGIARNAAACYGYTISCLGEEFSDNDGGAEDMEYHSITTPIIPVQPGGMFQYEIKFHYYPGCGDVYSGKFIVMIDKMASSMSFTLTDINGTNIYDMGQSWSGTGDFYAYLTVTALSSATDGDGAKLVVRLWSNDTVACNEHNTLDVITQTDVVFDGSPHSPRTIITSPNGSDMWIVDSYHYITWVADGGTGTLKIDLEYSTLGTGGPWKAISSGETNDGSYMWNVPDTPSTDCYVRATATDQSSPPRTSADLGDSAFFISSSVSSLAVFLTCPNGGELWTVGTLQDVTWIRVGGEGTLLGQLEYSTQGPSGPWNYICIFVILGNSKQLTVPDTPSTTCYMRITATDSSTPSQNSSDMSDSPFTITNMTRPLPAVTLNAPNGSESWDTGTLHDIKWTSVGGEGALTVTLEYSTTGNSGPWTVITAGEVNDGIYQWTVPDTLSAQCFIRVTATDSGTPSQSASDTNNKPFAIANGAVPEGIPADIVVAGIAISSAMLAVNIRKRKRT
jgi:hypothetical protein